jgi:hypothetical protein
MEMFFADGPEAKESNLLIASAKSRILAAEARFTILSKDW